MCSVEGCTRKHEARGLCKMHYNKAVRNGDIIQYPIVGRPKIYTEEEQLEKARQKAKERYYKKMGYNKGEKPKKPRKDEHPSHCMYANARSRAYRDGIPFNITLEDIPIPELCPMLGIKLLRGVGAYSDSSPTLDRIIPSLGYIKGNVQVISMRANRIKDNSTFEEFERMYLSWKLLHRE